jgi:hypothetical protein
MRRRSVFTMVLVVCAVVLVAAVGSVAVLAFEGSSGPVHHVVSRSFLGYPPQRAVDAVTAADWEEALREARRCVQITGTAGNREQSRLDSERAGIPSPVRTTNEEMVTIMRRGALNSLAQCSLIEAQSADRLGRPGEAQRAYERTRRLSYGRVYDSDTRWFWSPAERATETQNR